MKKKITSLYCKVEIKGEKIRSISRYGKRQTKEKALQKIQHNKDENIKELTLSFD